MLDALHQQHLTGFLMRSSERLDDLLIQVRDCEPHLLSAELLDEIAGTTGELMLRLIDYQSDRRTDETLQDVISHAQKLRARIRSHQMRKDQIAEAFAAFRHEVELIIRESKRAA